MPSAIELVDALAGAAFLAAGVVTANRRGAHRWGVLAVLGGAAWFVADASGPLVYVYRPLMAHAVLSHPSGRLHGRVGYGVVLFGWLGAVILSMGRNPAANVALGAGVVLAGAIRYAGDRKGFHRRSATMRWLAASTFGIAVAVPAVVRWTEPVSSSAEVVTIGHAAAVTVAGLVLLATAMLGTGWAVDAVDSVVELAELRPAGIDAMLTAPGDGRAGAERFDDPAIAAALNTAHELLAANVQLQGALRAQVDEVHRSRRRLVEVADVERRRLERRLTDGTGAQIGELETVLADMAACADGDALALIGRVQTELAALREDLVRLGRGLHARLLTEEGLRAAIDDLARRTLVPIDIAAPDRRLPAAVETTLWYVCAEAVTNAGKHALARSIRLSVVVDGDDAVATISDDGVGGARVTTGHGLAGLADRLDAVGGQLMLNERPEGGTLLQARVPIR